ERVAGGRDLRRDRGRVRDLGAEQLGLASEQRLLRGEHLLLELGELRRDVALAARDRLLADVVPRHLREVRLRDLDVVTEHAVVANLEAGDAAVLLLAGLDREDLVLAAIDEPAARIDLGVVAGADRAALLD